MDPSLQRAQLLIDQNRFDMARQDLAAFMARHPDDPLAHLLMAICQRQTKDYREATESAQTAIRLQPDNSRCHLILGSVYADRNRYDEAEASAMEALRLDPYDQDVYGFLAQIKYQKKQWQASLEFAESGLVIDPDDSTCASFRALALERLGKHDVAVTAAQESLSRNPDDSYAHATLGWALLNAGDYRQSQEAFREALRLDPSNQFAQQGMIKALNANHLVFRWMFKWYSFIGRMSSQVQWLIVLGLFFGQRILLGLADGVPALKPWIMPITFFYLAFAITTWVANPLFNTLLRFNKYGKYLLGKKEIMASNVMGGMLLVGGLLGVVLGLAVNDWLLGIMVGLGYGLFMLIPISAAFNCDPGYPLVTMTVVSILLGAAGLLAIFALMSNLAIAVPVGLGFVYGNVGAQFLGNYLASIEVKQ